MTIKQITPEKNEIDDNMLNLMESEFSKHEQGIAEWFKNSADAYLTAKVSDDESYIIFRTQHLEKKYNFEVIDFVGTTSEHIDKAFKRWGDPTAAKRGTQQKTYGGHGNGGKFYMRGMFKTSYFLTYRSGKFTAFGFDEKKRYGFVAGLRDKKMSPLEALKEAGIESIEFPQGSREKIMNGETGFTVVRGIEPKDLELSGRKKRFDLDKFCDKLRTHPQARHVIKHKRVSIMIENELVKESLLPEIIPSLPGFDTITIPVPEQITLQDNDYSKTFVFADNHYKQGTLTLCTSSQPMARNGRLGDMNRIEIIGEVGIIGSYRLNELGFVKRHSSLEFIYGECFCPILESPDENCVTNDRSRLVDNAKTKALLQWISEQVDELAGKIEAVNKKKVSEKNRKKLSEFNSILNKWMNNFLNTTMKDILDTYGSGDRAGEGIDGTGSIKVTKRVNPPKLPQPPKLVPDPEHTKDPKPRQPKNEEKIHGPDGKHPGGAGTKKENKYPIVLLSSIDENPLNPGTTVDLNERQPPLYQGLEDLDASIYWINTSREYAKHILDTYTAESMKWRDYHFQRVIDVVCKEAIRDLYKKDPTLFNADKVDARILDELVGTMHDDAMKRMKDYLVEEEYVTPSEELFRKLTPEERNEAEEEVKSALEAFDA